MPYTGPRDCLRRYLAGEHEAVWNDLFTVGERMDAALRAEAWEVALVTMKRVRAGVEVITERLRAMDYPFADYAPPWSAPAGDAADTIARIEQIAAARCPLSLKAFWQVVGQVNWIHAEDLELDDPPWGVVEIQGCDPLSIDGAATVLDGCVAEWLNRREENHPEVVGPLEVELAPDRLHKANISGGPPYAIRMLDAPDAVLENEEHGLPFVAYLRMCLRYGGFPGLAKYPSPKVNEFLATLCRGLEPF